MNEHVHKANVLIVDDLPEKILVYETILEDLGQNLFTASSGEEALKQILSRDFAVVLLDVNMPGMDGFETASLIRKRKRYAHTPIIFITAFADEMRSVEGYARGAVDYIVAPVSPDVLRAKVSVFVDLFQKTEQVKRQAEERLVLGEERTRRAAAEESNRRLEFLASAGALLGRTLDCEATARDLARLAVPFLSDQSIVALRLASADWQTIVCRCDEDGNPSLESGSGLSSIPSADIQGVVEAIYGTASTNVDPQTVSAEPGSRAGLIARPLIARGQTRGVLVLTTCDSGRSFGAADIAVADALASRASVALENGMLFAELQRADRHKNEFLSMLGHELRNPLAPIKSSVDLLRLLQLRDPTLDEACDVINRQVDHLVRLVDDLLDAARVTQGKIQLKHERIAAARIVANAVEMSRSLMEAKQHELAISVPPNPIWLEVDPIRLAQVLSNLLNNAAKYTERGGRVWLTVEQNAGQALFRVRDTGIGIPREILSKIFDLFVQADGSLDRSLGGLGIGLTLVRHLVEMHGGRIEAHSNGPGRGSEFAVYIPVVDEPSCDPTPHETIPIPASISVGRVLIVDDNVDAAKSLQVLLRARGNEVRIAHDGMAAVEIAKRCRPHVVFLDIGLPGMNGFEVARILRNQTELADTLIIAVTGYGQEGDCQQAVAAGCDHFLRKPVGIAELDRLFADQESMPHAG